MELLKQKLLLGARFDFQVSLRVWWSMLWRSSLAAIMVAIILRLPPSAYELKIKAAQLGVHGWMDAMLRQQTFFQEYNFFSADYLYHEIKNFLLPAYMGMVVSASLVFSKTYGRFKIMLCGHDDSGRSLLGWPAIAIGTVYILPTIAFRFINWLALVFVPDILFSTIMLVLVPICAIALEFYSAHLAVHWPYTGFRLKIIPLADDSIGDER